MVDPGISAYARDIMIARATTSGSIAWRKTLTLDPIPELQARMSEARLPVGWVVSGAATSPAGGIVLAGSYFAGPRFLARVGVDGELLWQLRFGPSTESAQPPPTSLSLFADGTIAAVSAEPGADPTNGPLYTAWIVSEDGELLAEHASSAGQSTALRGRGRIRATTTVGDDLFVLVESSGLTLSKMGRDGVLAWVVESPDLPRACADSLTPANGRLLMLCPVRDPVPGEGSLELVTIDIGIGAATRSRLSPPACGPDANATLESAPTGEPMVLGVRNDQFEVEGRYSWGSATCAWLGRLTLD
jgi:hypothetical protein